MKWFNFSLGTLFAIFLAAPHAAGASGYALGTVRVVNGHPVKGVEDGVIFSQTFDSSCGIVASGTPESDLAVAGTVASTLELDVGVLGCRKSVEPRLSCTWKVRPTPAEPSCGEVRAGEQEGAADFVGWQGSFSLPLPAETGAYELSMSCQATEPGNESSQADPPATFHRSLFVTSAEPLAWISPPQVDWYRRATCWGGGFGPGASEDDVLKAMLAALYEYGKLHWLYGYAYGPKDDSYRFPIVDTVQRSVSREYLFKDDTQLNCFNSGVCRCTWQQLVDPDSLCNFSDCFVFSRTFQAMAAVVGIGGLIPITLDGAAQLGFVTPASSRSFDEAFPGNVRCLEEKDENCYPYYFGSHSLRLRDGNFFDSTFGHVKSSADASIGLSVKGQNGQYSIFFDSPLVKRYLQYGYGTWPFYKLVLPDGSHDDSGPSPEPGFRYTSEILFKPSLPNPNGFSASLGAEIQVEVLREGTYIFHATLSKDGKVITDEASAQSHHPMIGTVTGPPGNYMLSLTLSGEDIYQSQQDGPYTLKVVGHDVREEQSRYVLTQEYTSPAYKYIQFGETPGNFGGIPKVEPATVDGQPGLRIEIPFVVRLDRQFAWEARLAKGDQTIDYLGYKKTLSPGERTLTLEVTLEQIRKFIEAGSYDLTVIVYSDDLQAINAWSGTITPFGPPTVNP